MKLTMFITHKTFFSSAAMVALFFTTCGAASIPIEVTIPDEPSAAMQTIVDEVIAGNCSILWRAMPTSYQKDLNSIAQLAGSKFDPEIYDNSFALFGRLAEVANKQKVFILNTSLGGEQLAEQIAEIEPAWASIIGLVQTVVASSISSYAGLRAFDGQVFSEQTLPAVFKYSNGLAVLSKEENPFGSLEFDSMKTLEKTDTTAVLEITFTKSSVKTTNLTKVENRWVTTEIANDWGTEIAAIKKQLEAISSEEIAKKKPQLMYMITLLDGIVTQLNAAETQAQFDQAIKAAIIPIGLLIMQCKEWGISAPMKLLAP